MVSIISDLRINHRTLNTTCENKENLAWFLTCVTFLPIYNFLKREANEYVVFFVSNFFRPISMISCKSCL